MSWNIFITRRILPAGIDILRENCSRVEIFDSEVPMPLPELLVAVRDRDGILVMGNDPVNAKLFDAAPKLSAVSCNAVGYDNIDVAEASRRGIAVSNTPDVLTDATADLTWALILAVARRVVEGDRLTRSGQWKGWSATMLLGSDLAGKTLGIVGAGRIGCAVARRATGFSMNLLYHSRSRKEEMEKLGAKRVGLGEIVRSSDYLCVHVPLSPETRHMFGEKEFQMMKPTAYYINMARGPVHDEGALVRALQEKRIAGAGLDVYENEPKLAPGLNDLPNVVLLPHIGSATVETRTKMSTKAAENLLAMLRGEPCANQVNAEIR